MKSMQGWGIVATSLLFCASLCSCWKYDDEDCREMFSSNKNPLVESLLSDGINVLGNLASPSGTALADASAIINLSDAGLGMVGVVDKLLSFAPDFFSEPGGEKKMLSIFEFVTDRLDQIQAGIDGIHERLSFLARSLPHMIRWEIAFDTIDGYARGIDNLFQRFLHYQKNTDRLEEFTLLDFAKSVVSHDYNSIHSLMAHIDSIAAPANPLIFKGDDMFASDVLNTSNTLNGKRKRRDTNKRKTRDTTSLRLSIFRKLLNIIENYDGCFLKDTPQQLIFSLYTMLSLAQVRGYIMSSFAYLLLEHYKEGIFEEEKCFSANLYTHYSTGMMKEAQDVLAQASSSLRKCDPKKHVEGETYEMITNFLQPYISNEGNLNTYGSCRYTCEFNNGGSKSSSIETELSKKQRPCSGQYHECRFIEYEGKACLSNDRNRRYDCIHFDKHRAFGRKLSSCKEHVHFSYWRRWFSICHHCQCLCDDYNSDISDRFVSLLTSKANTNENRVITGVRFVKKNRVIHIQIQEGTALPQGQVDQKSIVWKDVEPINVNGYPDRDGLDYFTLLYKSRKIDLDQLEAPKDHVVTGLGFTKFNDHLHLRMAVTPIDFTSGKLNSADTHWVTNSNRGRKELELDDPDDSRRSELDSLVDSHSNMYMIFQPTSLYKDASQLTVPFFDAQPVSPMPATWIEGVELYHKGRPKYGGFLGFKIFSVNLNGRLKTPTG